MHKKFGQLALLTAFTMVLGPGCDTGSDDDHSDETSHDDHGHDEGDDHGHEETEVISTIELTFTPEAGDPVVARFEDPDGDGGMSGTAEEIVLAASTTYTLSIRFLNELETTPEDITEEIKAEAEEHFVFASSTAPLAAAYADMESDYGMNAVGDDLPVGLAMTVTTDAAGMGDLRVMLRHLPPLNDTPQKTADLPQAFADGESLPGEVDADVTFEVTVE